MALPCTVCSTSKPTRPTATRHARDIRAVNCRVYPVGSQHVEPTTTPPAAVQAPFCFARALGPWLAEIPSGPGRARARTSDQH
eukprot:1024159-Prymnesium_polylepis.1